jgi:hypothetical protein
METPILFYLKKVKLEKKLKHLQKKKQEKR